MPIKSPRNERAAILRQGSPHAEAAKAKAGMDREKFIEVLDCLINGSDQSDAYVHVSWF